MKASVSEGYATKSLARWNKPICPLVAGIPAAQGEFILRGVSQAALAAGAKLGRRECKANFHVVVTSEPDELLVLWRKRAPRLFGGKSRTAVRRVMGTPRPIRIWYNAQEACGGGWTATQDAGGALAQMFAVGGCSATDSRLVFNAVRPISSVIVLVDFDDVKAMPFTPFHFGPGALVHSAAPKHISSDRRCVFASLAN